MKRINFIVVLIWTFCLVSSIGQLLQPQTVMAVHFPGHVDSPTVPPSTSFPTVPAPIVSPTVPPPSFSGTVGLDNPLDGIASITDFFLAILDILLVFAIPFVVFFIIYAGFMYVTARGDTGKIKTAHNALLYAIIGGLLILGARLILAVIAGTVEEFISMGSNFWLG